MNEESDGCLFEYCKYILTVIILTVIFLVKNTWWILLALILGMGIALVYHDVIQFF